jgi:hypothetical protein
MLNKEHYFNCDYSKNENLEDYESDENTLPEL